MRTLDELFATGSRDDLVAKLRAAEIVWAPINTLLNAPTIRTCWPTAMWPRFDYAKYGKRLKVHDFALAVLPKRLRIWASRRGWAARSLRIATIPANPTVRPCLYSGHRDVPLRFPIATTQG
jgi:hypothetical protein